MCAIAWRDLEIQHFLVSTILKKFEMEFSVFLLVTVDIRAASKVVCQLGRLVQRKLVAKKQRKVLKLTNK